MATVLCPSCSQWVGVPESLAGQQTPCPLCGQPLAVPVAGAKSGSVTLHQRPNLTPTGTTPAQEMTRSGQRLPNPSASETVLHGPATETEDLGDERFDFLLPPQESGEIGRLQHYRVQKALGRGGMGIVFLAEDTRLMRQVALKIMRPDMAKSPEARQRALREARVMAQIKSDYIVTVFEVGEVGELPFLAMEYLEGEPLDKRLERESRLPVGQVLRIGYQIARGLQAAHERGLIHRDIKPANIWLEAAGGRVKILDFGLARPAAEASALTHAGLVIGTPAYMAPEQAEGEPATAKSDLFSLGCLLYQMVTGQVPFTGATAMSVLKAVMMNDPAPPAAIDPSLPPELSNVIMHLLAKQPANRPESAAAAAEALRSIPLPASSSATPWPTPSPTPSPFLAAASVKRPRKSMLIGAALAGLAGLAVAGYFVFGMRAPSNSGRKGSAAKAPAAADGAAHAGNDGALVRGVTADRILMGMTAPLSGPSEQLGRDMRVGVETCFRQINDNGGVAGRQLQLVALDDGYEPDRALKNMRALYDNDRVFGVIGNVGTPTAEKTVPFALEKQLLFFGAFSGAKLLRKDPPDRYVFNFRASYEEETADIVRYLVEIRKIPAQAIAVFAQQDAYGQSGFDGVVKAMRKYGRSPEQILRVGYVRNTMEVVAAEQEIRRHPEIQAIIMVPVYRPAARFIQRLRDDKFAGIFTNVSFVGSQALADELAQYGPTYPDGVIVTQVVPLVDSQSTAVLRYRETLRQYFPNERGSVISLEGYIDASILAEALRRAGDHVTTDSVIDALESMHDLDLGIGTRINFGPSEHQGSHKVWGSVLDRSGHYQPLDLD